ncbi:MAG: hypothetical protein HXY35_03430 [Chloroflexi bacterium]|nr:hypothetical protein [Chloroflexota bacterium]
MTVVNDQGVKRPNWLWIGLGAAALFCICAVAVAVFLFYRVGKQVRESVSTDNESASKAAHEIAEYDLPPGYREQIAMDIVFYSFVMIAPESSATLDQPVIMLAQFDSNIDQEQMEQQLRQSFEQQAGRRGTDMRLVEVRKMTIRGEETDVAIYEGTDENGVAIRQLISTFPGKGGTAMLMIMGYVEGWDEDMVDTFIESIR